MILQYPDSKLVPEAKVRLLEVQEVLGEREFEVGRFYYLRQSYPASIARLQSLVEKYPLYSRADEALYLLGQDYEGQIARLRSAPTCDVHGLPRGCATEAVKGRYIGELSKKAGQAYSQILTRYPLMDRMDDAKKRLAALKQPIPRPTRGEVARNRAEMNSRSDSSVAQKALGLVRKGPDTSSAAKVGEPSLADPEPVAATSVVRSETYAAAGISEKSLGVEVVKPDLPAADSTGAPAADASAMGGSTFGKTPASNGAAPGSDPNELKPTASADPNELKPTDTAGDQALPPPPQVNEIQQGGSPSAVASADNTPASDAELSSSKKKKKKGLQKLVPF